nr:unnamed protein product [Leishmania braziliensis]
MSHYIEACRDDERFTARLEAATKEMGGLLLKTSRTRHELDRMAAEVHMRGPLHFYPCNIADCVDLAPSTFAGDRLGPPQVRDDLARNMLSAELAQWARWHLPSLVAPLIEAQVQQRLLSLRDSVDELRVRQAKVEKAAKDATERVHVHRADIHADFAASQEEMQRDLEEHQRGVKRQIAAWSEELRHVREDVLALGQQRVSASDRQEQRISGALQRQQTHVQETLEALEHGLQRWRRAMSRAVQKETQELHAQHRVLENRVAQAQGMLTSTADMAARCTAETRRLMEDAMCRSSEVRVCRRDVNRLEMLVQCSSLQTALLTGGAGSSDSNDSSTAPAAAPVVLNGLTQEMARFSDSLHAMVHRVDGLVRHVRQLEMAVARSTAVSSGQGTYHSSMRGVDEESSYGRSFASTSRPSCSYLSKATGLRGRCASAGEARAPSPLVQNDSIDVAPIHNGAAATKPRTTSVTLVSATQPVGMGSALGGGHYRTAGPEVQLTLTPLMSASPSSTTYHLPASHLSGSSLRFEDEAGDSHSTPVIVSDARPAPDVEGDRVILRSAAAGTGVQQPLERRATAHATPAETVEGDTQLGGVAKLTAGKTVAHGMLLPLAAVDASQNARQDVAPSLTHQYDASSWPAASALSAGNADVTYLVKRPSSFLAGGEAVAVAEDVALKRQSGSDHAERPVVATPCSPVDSYLSDTPAADLYDSKANVASAPKSSTPEIAQYTPAQASDSESERDNRVIARSALD